MKFIFGVIDPFINECWGLYAIDFDEDYDPYVYFVNGLIRRKIPFLVSPNSVECFEYWDVEWEKIEDSYKDTIIEQVAKIKKEMNTDK